MFGKVPYLVYCCGFKVLHIILRAFCSMCRLGEFIFTPLQGVCISCNVWKHALTKHRVAYVCVCAGVCVCVFNVAIALHSHSPTEQVDERGSDAVRQKFVLRCSCGFVLPSHCFFLFHPLSLSVVLSHLPFTEWLSPWQLQVWITSCLG